MAHYGSADVDCRMAFLQRLLDDPHPVTCGRCDRCQGSSLPLEAEPTLARAAFEFLRRHPVLIEPRKQWSNRSAIAKDRQLEQGRALCRWADGGWGELVRQGKQDGGPFDDQLVAALANLVTNQWGPAPAPTWITFVPSLRNPALVSDLAERVGIALGLPVVNALVKLRETEPQRAMENSSRQHSNVRGAFCVVGPVLEGPVLLLDDVVDSRWTITEIGAQLREAGGMAVYPLALADAGAS
jgi:ATP-dependent DNA helicase RecQ